MKLPILYHATREIKPFLGKVVKSAEELANGMRSAAITHISPVTLEKKALEIAPKYYGEQRPGFFTFTKKELAMHHTTLDSSATGIPMIVGVQPRSLEHWRPDYELHGYKTVKETTAALSAEEAQRLVGKSTNLNGDTIAISKINERGIGFEEHKNGVTSHRFLGLSGTDDNTMISTARYAQAFCDIAERECPASFHRVNEKLVSEIGASKGALKYMGNESLPIVSRDVYMDGGWQSFKPDMASRISPSSRTKTH